MTQRLSLFRSTRGLVAVCALPAASIAFLACDVAPGDTAGEDLTSVAEALGAHTSSFQDGVAPTSSYAGTRDTMLEAATPSTVHGVDTALSVDGDTPQSSLFQWDVSATIPTSAVVRSATLTFTVSDKSPETFTIYQSLRPWNEAQATWTIFATGNAWQTAGGTGSADRGSSALGTFTASSTGTKTIALSTSGVAAVQAWVTNPASNFGLVVDGAVVTNRLELRSSEYGTKASRPMLTIGWDDAAADAGTDGSTGGGPINGPWPGANAVTTVDGNAVFGGNLSGLHYQTATGSAPAVLWGVRNSPSTLFRLVWNGSIWTPDTAGSWGAGKTLKFPGNTGAPDSEDLVFPDASSPNVYVASERDGSGSSRPSILLFDSSVAGSTLVATREWNLVNDLPSVAANSGLEAITYLPDAYLTSRSFFDEHLQKTYDPADYANHAGGLFMVGLEANGGMYVYALDHVGGGFQRVAFVASGWPAIMSLAHDRDVGAIWAYCDDTCGNVSKVFDIDSNPGSPTFGRFTLRATFARPSTMANINNEGITFAPESECVSGVKSFFWTDDSETSGHAIRRDAIPCGRFY